VRGFASITEELLSNNTDVNGQGGLYGDALQAASAGGHNQIVQRLLEEGADVNAQGGHYDNALQTASDRGHGQISQRLKLYSTTQSPLTSMPRTDAKAQREISWRQNEENKHFC
jgi:ankyrin repeat protein